MWASRWSTSKPWSHNWNSQCSNCLNPKVILIRRLQLVSNSLVVKTRLFNPIKAKSILKLFKLLKLPISKLLSTSKWALSIRANCLLSQLFRKWQMKVLKILDIINNLKIIDRINRIPPIQISIKLNQKIFRRQCINTNQEWPPRTQQSLGCLKSHIKP